MIQNFVKNQRNIHITNKHTNINANAIHINRVQRKYEIFVKS